MNYDTSLSSQHVYSFRAPIIRNIWLFRRYVSYLALSNSTDVDSRDNSECTHTCVFVRDVWYEMCVLIPSSVIWTCGSSSPADFIISTRLLCALLLCLLSVCAMWSCGFFCVVFCVNHCALGAVYVVEMVFQTDVTTVHYSNVASHLCDLHRPAEIFSWEDATFQI